MQVQSITMQRDEALKMYRKYQTHRHWSQPIDAEISRVFAAISKGKLVIRALASIAAAGLGDDGLPKLAIARADAREIFLSSQRDGSRMSSVRWPTARTARSQYVDFPADAFPGMKLARSAYSAIVPHIPPDVRPKRGIQNYAILFEAEWSTAYPIDPMLLRRIGNADLWVVCAAWDLGDVECEVLAAAQRRST